MRNKRIKRAALVYQAGIANVFAVDSWNLSDYGREAQRVYQGDFKTAESIALGLAIAGVLVATCHCNRAGDITKETWSQDFESAPFTDQMTPVYTPRRYAIQRCVASSDRA